MCNMEYVLFIVRSIVLLIEQVIQCWLLLLNPRQLSITSRAHWLLARLTLNEQNLKPAKLSMIHKFFDVWQVFRMW